MLPAARRFLLASLALVMVLPLASQEVPRPRAVLEPGPFFLDWGFKVFVTAQGRVLAFHPPIEDESPQRLAIWNGLTGELVHRALEELDPQTRYSYGCGGDGFTKDLTLWNNQKLPLWNSTSKRFQWAQSDPSRIHTLDERGQPSSETSFLPNVASLREHGADLLEVVAPGESPWFLSCAGTCPEGFKQSPLQRMIAGRIGFQDAIADRGGHWVASIWEGAVESKAPNRSVVPYQRDNKPRWMIWHQGTSAPVMNVALASILGDTKKINRMILNVAGDRVIVETDSRVAVIDPKALAVLSLQEGHILDEIPGRNHLLIAKSHGQAYIRIDLANGDLVSAFALPNSLDPVEPENPVVEEDHEIPDQRRSLGSPIAFSPDGRYMVTPRFGRQGAHWDGLVLWDLDSQ